ncbi:ATP-binding protein [Desulfobacterales bacterium HSG17]|nr:ATP-binding protein [Desulfobacterales bacterium HSG17]
MDVAENGVAADAGLIEVIIDEDRNYNRLSILIRDNGQGMTQEAAEKALDPFITSRTTRRVGLGLSLLKAAAERCEGDFNIASQPGKGTTVSVWFRYDHIDRSPLGDMPGTIMTMVMGNPGIDYVYIHRINGVEFDMDTRELAEALGPEALQDPLVIRHLSNEIREKIKELATASKKEE